MLKIDDFGYFNKSPKLNYFCFRKHLGVARNSFMDMLSRKLYEYYYGNATPLHREYVKFYKKEFNAFDDYLIQRHNMNSEEVKRFANKRSFYKDLNVFRYDQIVDLMEDKEIASAVDSYDERV